MFALVIIFVYTVPGPPRIVRAFCSEVVWGSPFHPNGKIIGYDLEFYDEKGIVDTYVIKRGADEHFCNVDEDEALAREFTHIRVCNVLVECLHSVMRVHKHSIAPV